jgi:hypothetical protein
MDQGASALLGAFIGASAGIGGGVLLEMYKRNRDREGFALALGGEIYSIIHVTEQRQIANGYAALLPRLDAEDDVKMPPIFREPGQLDPIMERHLDKIGFLKGDLPFRVGLFYSNLQAVRSDLIALARGHFNGQPKTQALMIRRDIALWNETVKIGQALVTDLHNLHRKPFPLEVQVRQIWTGIRGRMAR